MDYFNFQGIQFEVEEAGYFNYSNYSFPPLGYLNCKLENATLEQIEAIESFGINRVPEDESELLFDNTKYLLKDLILREFRTNYILGNSILKCQFTFTEIELLPLINKMIRGFFAQ